MLFDPHRKWGPKAICTDPEDMKLFFAPGGQPDRSSSKATQRLWDQAKEICAICPALAECKRDTLGEPYGVFGGLDERQRYLIRRKLGKAVRGWPRERQLAWGEELHRLREEGVHWTSIQNLCGMPPGAAEYLVKLWQEQQKRQKKPRVYRAKVVDLELPEPRDQMPFPDRPGRRDAWVRHRGVISDAWYRGQTADGAWINVTTFAGRGQVHKWFPAEDVHIYRPQAVVILNYSKAA